MFALLPAIVLAFPLQSLPPLSFRGFRAGMPVVEALAVIRSAGGTLTCKSTSDARLRECTGTLPRAAGDAFDVLISTAHDSVAVLVLSARQATATRTGRWVTELSQSFGEPKRSSRPGGRSSWQWIRKGTMLRVAERRTASARESSITLTHGPLLDRLGPESKKPDALQHPALSAEPRPN